MKAYRGYGAPNRSALNELDCPDCGGWFHSFDALAAHVKKIHSQPSRPAFVPVTETSEDDMRLPASTRAAATKPARAASGRIPGSSREASNDYNPFLKAADIGPLGSTAKLTLTGNVRMSSSNFGDQIVVEARIGKLTFDYGVKVNSPNHRELEDTLGLNAAKWRNKVIAVEVKEHMNREYIAIVRSRSQATGKAKTATRKNAKRVKR